MAKFVLTWTNHGFQCHLVWARILSSWPGASSSHDEVLLWKVPWNMKCDFVATEVCVEEMTKSLLLIKMMNWVQRKLWFIFCFLSGNVYFVYSLLGMWESPVGDWSYYTLRKVIYTHTTCKRCSFMKILYHAGFPEFFVRRLVSWWCYTKLKYFN